MRYLDLAHMLCIAVAPDVSALSNLSVGWSCDSVVSWSAFSVEFLLWAINSITSAVDGVVDAVVVSFSTVPHPWPPKADIVVDFVSFLPSKTNPAGNVNQLKVETEQRPKNDHLLVCWSKNETFSKVSVFLETWWDAYLSNLSHSSLSHQSMIWGGIVSLPLQLFPRSNPHNFSGLFIIFQLT